MFKDNDTEGTWESIGAFFDTAWGHYVGAFIVLVFAWAARFVFIQIVENYLMLLTRRTKTDVDDKLVRKIKAPIGNIIFLIGVYFAVMFLDLPRAPYDWHHLLFNIIDTLIIVMVLWAILRIIDLISHFLSESWKKAEITQYDQMLPFLRDTGKVLSIVGAIIAVTIAWDKNPAALLAGLGIGGLAIGFAAKDTISNIFGSVTIFADKPFDTDDWVIIGSTEGTIEEVGFRTTKVRTFDKSLVTIPNSIIANTPVENFSRRPHRRVKQNLGILYETPIDKIEEAVNGIRKILEDHEKVELKPMLVYFDSFGDSALGIFVYYFTATANWNDYLAIKQEVNLEIMRLFENLDIEFAYPTSTLWHRGDIGFGNMPRLTDGDIDSDL